MLFRSGSVTQALDTLVATCLEKSPSDRPQSAREVLAQIDAALSGSGSGAASIALARQTSLSKAIGIWAAIFVATWILARAAVVGIGLPEWTVPLALTVAGLGLPAVLITWYVQRTARRALLTTPMHTPGGTQAYSTMATMALRAAPVVSWKRTWRGGLIGGGAVIVAVGVVMVLRAFGLGPAASLLNSGAIGKDSRVLVAQFTSSTADTSLGTVVSAAMRTSLGQSKAIQLVSPGDVAAGLQRMKMDANATLDDKTAQMFAMRDGIPLVVTGTVSPVGTGYMVTANLVRADSGIALVTEQRAATGVGDLLDAVDKVAKGMRSRIGESLRSIARAPSLERATTSSLAALRDYSRAVELGDLRGEFDKAVPLLQQALKEDSTFAQAWRKLAAYRVSAGGTLSEAFAAAAAAYRYRERLPDDERYEVEAYYTRELSTKGGADYYAAHTDFLSQNNRVISLYNLGQMAAAESVAKAQIAADVSKGRKPIVQLRTNLIWTLVGQDKLEEARKAGGIPGAVLEGVGGMGTGAGAIRAIGTRLAPGLFAPGAGWGANYAQNVTGGAGLGAVNGALDAKDGERLQGAATGGLLGGSLSAVAPIVMYPFQKAGHALWSYIKPQSAGEAQVVNTMLEARMTPQQVNTALAAAQAEGQGSVYTVADALGKAGREKLTTVTKYPGPGRTDAEEFLVNRQLGAGRRVTNAITEGFQAPQTAANARARAVEIRDAAADRNYGRARADVSGPVNLSPAIEAADNYLAQIGRAHV